MPKNPSREPRHPKRGSLAEYDRKRDFSVTPEPPGEVAERPTWSYLVQKHAARRLHYDLRLELDGVLKSWAVPKGPDLDPAQKHLAVHVEDHPIEYGTFEGIIPRGEYGGGTVLLWDRGFWFPLDRRGRRPEDDDEAAQVAREGLRKGKLHFRLHGEKLAGDWKLVRMHGKASDGGKNWLLIKSDDGAARSSGPHVTEARPESVATGRTIEQIAADPDRVWSSQEGERAPRPGDAATPSSTTLPTDPLPPPDLPDLGDLPGVRKGVLPEQLPTPQLATRVADAPTGDAWFHEIKHDGYRLLARVDRRGKAPDVRLVTRGGEDWTEKFRPLAAALEALPVDAALLDGEAVAVAPDGTSDFGRLQRALAEGREQELALYLFDLLHLDGRDLSAAPLERRKEVLAALLAPFAERYDGGGVLRYSDHLEGRGRDFHRQACRLRLEGIVSKRRDRPYRPGRGGDWVKARCSERQELVIGGWTDPSGSRTGFGSLVLGVHPAPGEAGTGSGKLVYAGRVGTGFDSATLHALSKRLAALATDEPPFLDPGAAKKGARGVHWVEPRLVCEVEFTEWTEDGRLRHPSFQGLREDKAPEDVVREAPLPEGTAQPDEDDPPLAPETRKEVQMSRSESKKSTSKKSTRGAGRVDVAGVSISHPDRVVFPEQGLTKRQIAEYYETVAERILPHLEDRPLSLVRCPEGRTECFYQKHVDKSFPDAVGRVEVEEKEGKARTYAMANDAAGVVGLVQMGVLELHPWGARRDRLNRPDLLTFDLDPDPRADYDAVVDGARAVRDLLDHLGLTSFVKTSGGKGLHVVVPIDRRTGWDAARAFTRAVAEALAEADPDRFLAQASKEKRKGKVFVDYLRNARGATSVAAYSTRAREGAPVSMPLRWDEIGSTGPADHTVENTPRRIASQKADPWEGVYQVRQSLTRKVFDELGVEPPKE